MSGQAIGWQEAYLFDDRRRLRNGLLISLAVHASFLGMLAISPSRTVPPLPDVLSVDLIAAPAAAPAPTAAPKPSAKPPAEAAPKPQAPKPPPPKPAPKAAPKPPPPPPPPPIAKAPVQALPENVPTKVRKVAPAPKVDPRLRPKEKELSYDEAMASLGVGPEQDDVPQAASPAPVPEQSSGSPSRRNGIAVSPEMLAWVTATTRRIQSNWKGISTYEGRGLATSLELELSARGDVLGTPRVVRSSGDPYFDDNAVRAVMMVSPLPAPPRAGLTVFVFKSEGD